VEIGCSGLYLFICSAVHKRKQYDTTQRTTSSQQES